MKNFRLVLIVILTAIILTACGPAAEPAADEPIEIVIWNTWSDHHVEAFKLLMTSTKNIPILPSCSNRNHWLTTKQK